MHQEMGPPLARPPEREVRGAAAPREEKKGGYENRHACPLLIEHPIVAVKGVYERSGYHGHFRR